MRRQIGFILVLSPLLACAEIPAPPVGSVWIDINSSYWTLGSVGCYIYAAQDLHWHTNQLQQWQDNRSGNSLLGAQEWLQKYGSVQAAHVVAGGNIYVEYWSDNNGGYNPSSWHTDFLKLIQAPGLMYDGVSYSDPGGIMASQAGTWKYIIGGSIPVGPASSSHYFTGSADQLLDQQAWSDGVASCFLGFSNFYYLNSVANWTNDIVNGTKLREISFPFGFTPDEEHPGTSGAFAMAVHALQQRIDTNTWTAIVDYNTAAETSTNHCVVVNASRTGNSISITVLPDGYSMPFDMPDPATGRTNTCAPAFVLQPAYSNAFYEDIVLQNMPDGNWQVSEDNSNILVTTGAVLRGGLNWFAITKGTDWDKRRYILDLYRTRYGYDTNTLVVSNGGTAFGEQTFQSNLNGLFDEGERGDTLITDALSAWTVIHNIDMTIWAASVPINHTFKFTLISSGNSKHARVRVPR